MGHREFSHEIQFSASLHMYLKIVCVMQLSFKDIRGMVEHNTQLRTLVRSLGQQNEQREQELKVCNLAFSLFNPLVVFLALSCACAWIINNFSLEEDHVYCANLQLLYMLSLTGRV